MGGRFASVQRRGKDLLGGRELRRGRCRRIVGARINHSQHAKPRESSRVWRVRKRVGGGGCGDRNRNFRNRRINSRRTLSPLRQYAIWTSVSRDLEAELGGLADAQGGAMLYRSGITGFNSATEGQYWSMMNPATTEGYAELMGMPSQVGAEGYPFIVSARLVPGAAAIARFAPAVEGGGVGGALEVVVESAAEALEVGAFIIP